MWMSITQMEVNASLIGDDEESEENDQLDTDEDQISETATAELLCRHHDMGHISFAKLQQMA